MRKILSTAACLLGASIATAHAQASDAILDRIKQKKQISIGYREASIPFSFLNDQRKPVGYALDICSKVVDAVKQKLEVSDLAVNFVAVNPQNRIALVVNGTVDIECGSTVNTISRQSRADFSGAHFISATRLLVKAGSGIKEVEDLDGKAIALPINTTPERLIKGLIEDKKLKMKAYEPLWWQFGLESPPMMQPGRQVRFQR